MSAWFEALFWVTQKKLWLTALHTLQILSRTEWQLPPRTHNFQSGFWWSLALFSRVVVVFRSLDGLQIPIQSQILYTLEKGRDVLHRGGWPVQEGTNYRLSGQKCRQLLYSGKKFLPFIYLDRAWKYLCFLSVSLSLPFPFSFVCQTGANFCPKSFSIDIKMQIQ